MMIILEERRMIVEKIFGFKYVPNALNLPLYRDEEDKNGKNLLNWNPFKDLNAAYEVEEKIKEMGLEDEYASCLESLTSNGLDSYIHSPEFVLLHASAEDRCKAALKAVERKD